jgi:hypothetical protein
VSYYEQEKGGDEYGKYKCLICSNSPLQQRDKGEENSMRRFLLIFSRFLAPVFTGVTWFGCFARASRDKIVGI